MPCRNRPWQAESGHLDHRLRIHGRLGFALFEPVAPLTRDFTAAVNDDDEVAPVLRRVGPPKAAVGGATLVVFMKAEVPTDANLFHAAGPLHSSGDCKVLKRLATLYGRTQPTRLATAAAPAVAGTVTELSGNLHSLRRARSSPSSRGR